jgi:molecular chaperone GrpE
MTEDTTQNDGSTSDKPTDAQSPFDALKAPSEAHEDVAAIDPKEAQIATLSAEVADLKDKYLRALAESKNVMTRARKDREDWLKYEGEKILRDMLEVVDNLERAALHSGDDAVKLKEGLTLVHQQFVATLTKWGVVAEDSRGKPFSPEKHFALSKMVTADHPPGTVVDQLAKPYFYKDKLLRAGQVVVSAKE